MLHGRTPWTARSEYELVKNIETKPLFFNEKLSKETIDFIRKTLAIEEDKRMGWDELFRHPIF